MTFSIRRTDSAPRPLPQETPPLRRATSVDRFEASPAPVVKPAPAQGLEAPGATAPTPANFQACMALNSAAIALHEAGEEDGDAQALHRADALYQQVLHALPRALEAAGVPSHERAGITDAVRASRGSLLRCLGRYDEAEALLKQVASEQGARNDYRMSTTLSNLAAVHEARGDLESAGATGVQAVAAARAAHQQGVFADSEEILIKAVNMLGSIWEKAGDAMETAFPTGAEQRYQNVLGLYADCLPRTSEQATATVRMCNNIGLVRQARQDWAGAAEHFQRALSALASLGVEDGPLHDKLLNRRADSLARAA